MTAATAAGKSAPPIRARAAATAIFLANGFGIGIWAASIAPVKHGLGLSDGELGIALLAFAVGAILTMPATGHIVARFGSARVTVCAGLVFAVALALPAAMPGFASVTLAILALGASNGAMDVAMNGHGTMVERAWGRPIMSSLHAAFSLGCLLGSASGGGLLRFGFGPLAAMGTASAVAFLLTFAASMNLRLTPATAAGAVPPVGFAWPGRAVLQVGMLAFLCMFVEGAIGDWSGVYLNDVVGTSVGIAAFGFSGFSLAMTVGRLIGDRIVFKLGRPRVLTLGAGLAAAGLALTLAVPRVETAVIGYCLTGIGLANIVPVLFSAAGNRMKGHPGIGVAMAATCGYAGFLASPPLIGFVANAAGLRLALIVLVLAALIIVLFAHRVLRGERAGPAVTTTVM